MFWQFFDLKKQDLSPVDREEKCIWIDDDDDYFY